MGHVVPRWFSQTCLREAQDEAGLPAGCWFETLLRLVQAAPTVEPLPHFARAFRRSAPGWEPLARLVPARLLEDEPHVPSPEGHVNKTKNLQEESSTSAVGSSLSFRVF